MVIIGDTFFHHLPLSLSLSVCKNCRKRSFLGVFCVITCVYMLHITMYDSKKELNSHTKRGLAHKHNFTLASNFECEKYQNLVADTMHKNAIS